MHNFSSTICEAYRNIFYNHFLDSFYFLYEIIGLKSEHMSLEMTKHKRFENMTQVSSETQLQRGRPNNAIKVVISLTKLNCTAISGKLNAFYIVYVVSSFKQSKITRYSATDNMIKSSIKHIIGAVS